VKGEAGDAAGAAIAHEEPLLADRLRVLGPNHAGRPRQPGGSGPVWSRSRAVTESLVSGMAAPGVS